MKYPAVHRLDSGRACPTSPTAAFTLIELLTVIAIIGILAAILIPVAGMVRKNARNSQCVANIRQYAVATQLYANDNRGYLPKTAWAIGGNYGHYHLAPYINEVVKGGSRITWLSCPTEGWVYGLNAFISEARADSIKQPSRQMLGVCSGAGWLDTAAISGTNNSLKTIPKPHSGKVNVVYLSGNVAAAKVSTLRYADVRRDTRYYKDADETTYFLGGDPQYDK